MCRSAYPEIALPYARLNLCPKCFSRFFVNRVVKTVRRYDMFKPKDYVAVAVSGGKDSAALLHALKLGFPDQKMVAIHINLGIKGYSKDCEEKVRKLVDMVEVPVIIYDLSHEEGFTIDDFVKTRWRRRVCSACGTIKRHIFNAVAYREGVDVLLTGHNLDDVLAVMFKMFVSGDFEQLSRLTPTLPKSDSKMVGRGKPLLRTPEHEALLYAGYNELPVRSRVCPHSDRPVVEPVKAWINGMEAKKPGFKYQLLSSFLKIIPALRKPESSRPILKHCKICGFPTTSDICSKCRLVKVVKMQS